MVPLKRGDWARKTEFSTQPDGSVRRVITRRDGKIEKDEIIPAEKALVAAARAATGLSQAAFAKLLGVSVRTLPGMGTGTKSAIRSGSYLTESSLTASRGAARVGSIAVPREPHHAMLLGGLVIPTDFKNMIRDRKI